MPYYNSIQDITVLQSGFFLQGGNLVQNIYNLEHTTCCVTVGLIQICLSVHLILYVLFTLLALGHVLYTWMIISAGSNSFFFFAFLKQLCLIVLAINPESRPLLGALLFNVYVMQLHYGERSSVFLIFCVKHIDFTDNEMCYINGIAISVRQELFTYVIYYCHILGK